MVRPRALFSFGVIADVQYADKESRASGSRPQSLMRYRNGVAKLTNAVQEWSTRREELSFTLSLGDIIDGNATAEGTLQDLETALEPLEKLVSPFLTDVTDVTAVEGMAEEVLLEKLGLGAMYYSTEVFEGWKLIVLNSNDLGLHAEEEQQKKETEAFLEKYPLASCPEVQHWNGGVAAQQIIWLREQLRLSKESGQRVIIACHHPFGKSSARQTHMAWNSTLLESIVVDSETVDLVLSGHDHVGGYSHINQTHFLTLPGVVEAPEMEDAFGVIHVMPEEIQIEGRGTVFSQTLPLRPAPTEPKPRLQGCP